MDTQGLLTAYTIPAFLLVLGVAAWAYRRGLMEMRHFDFTMGAAFAGCSYLAACDGQAMASIWYGGFALAKGFIWYRQRPRPLDGSHEAL